MMEMQEERQGGGESAGGLGLCGVPGGSGRQEVTAVTPGGRPPSTERELGLSGVPGLPRGSWRRRRGAVGGWKWKWREGGGRGRGGGGGAVGCCCGGPGERWEVSGAAPEGGREAAERALRVSARSAVTLQSVTQGLACTVLYCTV